MFDNGQRAVDFNHRNKRLDRMPSIAKKRLLRKKFKKHFFSSFQKKKTTQSGDSVYAQRIEKVKNTKFELELTIIVDCFFDDHGNYDSKLISFKKTFVNSPFSEFQRNLDKSIGSANDIFITHIKNPSAIRKAITSK